ncbi:MAG: putative Ig domain-containing protein [Chloroflexi bacterium]|nr:putative Ig domain-containing protein [Chloroflexota bacterium]
MIRAKVLTAVLIASAAALGTLGTVAADTHDEGFLYEIYSGLIPSTTPDELLLTEGWHSREAGNAYAGLDITLNPTTAYQEGVYSLIKTVRHEDQHITAWINARTSKPGYVSGCRQVGVEFRRNGEVIGILTYKHVRPLPELTGETIPVARVLLKRAGETVRKKLGTISEMYDEDDENEYSISDGAGCPSGGYHLHQEASKWQDYPRVRRNLNVENTPFVAQDLDLRFGFLSVGRGSDTRGTLAGGEYRPFCSDTWLIRVQESSTPPDPSPIATCDPPSSVEAPVLIGDAVGGAKTIHVQWEEPEGAWKNDGWQPTTYGYAVTGYEYQIDTDPDAPSWTQLWKPVEVTVGESQRHSAVIPVLQNGQKYAVRLRAVNDRGKGGPSNVLMATTHPAVQVSASGAGDVVLNHLGLVGGASGQSGARGASSVLESIACDRTSTCELAVPAGDTVQITAEPDAGYQPTWGGACAARTPSHRTCDLLVDANKTVSVEFEEDTAPQFPRETARYRFTLGKGGSHTLPAATGGNGTLTYQLSGLPAWLTFDAAKRTLSGWARFRGLIGTVAYTYTVTDGDRNTAASDQDTMEIRVTVSDVCTLAVAAHPPAGGTVSGGGTVACGGQLTAQVTSVTDGYRFAGWEGACSGTERSCTVTVGQRGGRATTVTATATFEAISCTTCTLTVSKTGNGSVEPAPGTHPYAHGSAVTVTATPDDGHQIASWGGACSDTETSDATCELTMDADKSASVEFEAIPCTTCTLTVSKTGNGSVEPAPGTHPYAHGSAVTVTATPDDGHQIASWGGACSDTETSDATCELTMDADKSVSVTFEEDDGTPDVTIAAVDASIMEGADAEFTVTRTGATTAALAVTVRVTQSGSFIDGTAPTAVTILANNASAMLSVATDDDSTDEPNGSITATLTDGTAYDLGTSSSATVTVRDNDGDGVVDPPPPEEFCELNPNHPDCTDPPPPPPPSCPPPPPPPAPPSSRTVETMTHGTETDGNAQRSTTTVTAQPQSRSVACSNGAWVLGPWQNSRPATVTVTYGDWTCTSQPAQPAAETRTRTISITYSPWSVTATNASRVETTTKRDDVRPYVWVGPKPCKWVIGNWDLGTPYKQTRTINIAKPPDTSVPYTSTEYGYRWVTSSAGTFCIQQQQRRSRTRTDYHARTWSWGGLSWVEHTSDTPHRIVYSAWSGWANTGTTRPCPGASSGVGGAVGEPTSQTAQLPAGAYRMEWGSVLFEFQVPAGAVVLLRGETDATGAYVAVFTAADGTEFRIDPAALPAPGAVSGSQSHDVTEPTLAALADTLRRAPPPASPPPPVEGECAAFDGAEAEPVRIALDGDGPPCTVVNAGGPVTVRRGDVTRTFTLPAGEDWLVLDGSSDGMAAVLFATIPSNGSITLALSDGAELAREVPPAFPGLAAVFDAFTPAPDPSDE